MLGWRDHRFVISGMQIEETTYWNDTLWLWDDQRRKTVRVIMVITMDTTALLLFWALLDLVCRRERRREGVMFILKLCYVNSVILNILFLNTILYIHPSDPSCPAVVGLMYVTILCSMSWALLCSMQRLLTWLHISPEQVQTQRRAFCMSIVYLVVGYGIPCAGLITLLTQFYSNDFVAPTMCWLSTEAVWWLIIPAIFFVGGTYTLALVAFKHYRETPAEVRCFVYCTFLLTIVFSSAMVMVQVDVMWPSIHKCYITLLLVIIHNTLVWFHLTDALLEFCPCGRSQGASAHNQHTIGHGRPVQTVFPILDRLSRAQGRGTNSRRNQANDSAPQGLDGSDPNQSLTTMNLEGDAAAAGGALSQGKSEQDKLSLVSGIMDDMGACEEQAIILEGLGVVVVTTGEGGSLKASTSQDNMSTRSHLRPSPTTSNVDCGSVIEAPSVVSVTAEM